MNNAELENKYADETLEQLSEWLESQGQVWLQRHHIEDYRQHKHKSAQAAAMERLFYQIKHRLDAAIKRREAEQNKPEKDSGNAAALREALESTEELLEHFAKPGTMLGDAFFLHMRDNRAALAAPARNCDVGTPEEQFELFSAFCKSGRQWDDEDYCSSKCPLDKRGGCEVGCAFHWSQMPFAPAEGETK